MTNTTTTLTHPPSPSLMTKTAKIVQAVKKTFTLGDTFTTKEIALLAGVDSTLVNGFFRKPTNRFAVEPYGKNKWGGTIFKLLDPTKFVYSPEISENNFSGRFSNVPPSAFSSLQKQAQATSNRFFEEGKRIKVKINTGNTSLDDHIVTILNSAASEIIKLVHEKNTQKELDVSTLTDEVLSSEVIRRLASNNKRRV